MELNNFFLRVATGNPEIVKNVVQYFNETYGTDFSIRSIEDLDGVTFVLINTNSASIDDIYLLGFFHGAEIQNLRQKGEIDW
ncbi:MULTISPECIES: hypothetical protein [Capnocytophaga]|uniref:Uncharacterized protein n=2 Tax=Capnocytophaga TaxID=1016 RepID=A0A3A1YEG8_9FLAO|nr:MULTISPECIES: hypothetical protein [Capnocytophaga]ATA91581.1 hypothetical protein CGC56_04990 [Capnocytophaga canimorsus]RIY35941.1 hypothetical protein CKY20_08765 [Capnocytophaga canis]WGU68583.1 hypothetical protein QIU19_00730 [Capnocytophaga canimorsus]